MFYTWIFVAFLLGSPPAFVVKQAPDEAVCKVLVAKVMSDKEMASKSFVACVKIPVDASSLYVEVNS